VQRAAVKHGLRAPGQSGMQAGNVLMTSEHALLEEMKLAHSEGSSENGWHK